MNSLSAVGATSPVMINSGYFSLDISGTFVATITLQRAPSTIAQADLVTSDYMDVEDYTAETVDTGIEGSRHWYRAEIKTGAYTSGTATIRITQ